MTATPIVSEPLSGPMAWTASSPIDNDGVVTLDADCLSELHTVAAILQKQLLPATLLDHRDFELDHCRRACAAIRDTLDNGVGFVIIDRLPIEDYDYDISVKLYWLMLSMVGRPVAQKWNGEMIYDVTDTGGKATAGSGIRSSKTNGGQRYHTDNAFNVPPSFVSLLCLKPAMEGGESGIISIDTVYNQLLEKYPEVLPRLYEPFHFDRQREHAEDEPLVNFDPVFQVDDGVLRARMITSLIRNGYTVAGKSLDAAGDAALKALDDIMSSPDLCKTFGFESGQIQILNNTRIGHRRTAFKDNPDPAQKRHLVRIWLRDHGKQFYAG